MRTMKRKKFLQAVVCLSIITLLFSCSKDDDEIPPVDNRSFITDEATGYFINIDGSINLAVSGTFNKEDDFGARIEKGFVYGTKSKPKVSENNTVILDGSSSAAFGYIRNLESGMTYFIRGYFKYDSGTFFYGDEIEVSTDIDASESRDISLKVESKAYLTQVDFITVYIKVISIENEMPVELGIEYSLKSDFSDTKRNRASSFDGAHDHGVLITTSYQAVAEPLQSGTTYYFRPYAKYSDGLISNGGTSPVTFTTVSMY